jgi:branched-chain amino acid transport system ATP-binding protein
MKMLEVVNLSRTFGGLKALNSVTFSIHRGEIFGIIGPNGAGKTTLFNLISGALRSTTGDIIFLQESITDLPMHTVARKGLARTFQASVVWKDETVLNNVLLAGYLHRKSGFAQWFWNTKMSRLDSSNLREKALRILHYMKLDDVKEEVARNLPHGKLRALGICFALMTDPKMILLDEPVTGMNPVEKADIVGLLKGLRKDGLTIVIIEHDMSTIMNMVDRIVVLDHGKVIAEGLPGEIKANEEVIKAYLGTG